MRRLTLFSCETFTVKKSPHVKYTKKNESPLPHSQGSKLGDIGIFYKFAISQSDAKGISMKHILLKLATIVGFISTVFMMGASAYAADPTVTKFNATQCQGSAMPYPTPTEKFVLPDSLTPVFINHVGRHGSRYLSSAKDVNKVRATLLSADSLGSLTPAGKRVLILTDRLLKYCDGRWGALDSLGIAEQRGIASRMFKAYPSLFKNGKVVATSSKVPRCVNSMYTYLYQLSRLNSNIDISATSGPAESPLLRPFDTNQTYLNWLNEDAWQPVYDEFTCVKVPLQPLIRLVGKEYKIEADEARSVTTSLYSIVAGLEAMSFPFDSNEIFTLEEYNALWACKNLAQYLKYTTSTLSPIPAEIASPLLLDLIQTTQRAVDYDLTKHAPRSRGTLGKMATSQETTSLGGAPPTVMLRFGHAETLMPLFSLMRIPGSYYLTNYFDTVALHWQNFNNVPMAANLQMLLTRSRSGRYYLYMLHSERPISLTADTDPGPIEWHIAKERLLKCIPIYLQTGSN